jgi:hypothetical protein
MSSTSYTDYIRVSAIKRKFAGPTSKSSFLSLVMLAFSVLLTKQAWATTHWVDALALGPAPGKGCGTSAGYTTIQAAVTAAAPGDGNSAPPLRE